MNKKPVEIRRELNPLGLAQQLTYIYAEAFKPHPYNKTPAEAQAFATGLTSMVKRQDFELFVAWDAEIPVGFAYGYHLLPEYGWHRVLGPPLEKAGHGDWLNDAYCLAEMALVPSHWGLGIGGQLHDTLFEGKRYRHFLLSTMQDDSTNGYKLYLKRGWINLLENYWVSHVDRAYRVMGRSPV